MNVAESFRDKTFVIADPDARVRNTGDLMTFSTTPEGHFITIPKGTNVIFTEIRLAETGSRGNIVFGYATAADGSRDFGWTSTRNVDGKFTNETIGIVTPKPGAGRFGSNAAWSRGQYIGQLELVTIISIKLELEHIAITTAKSFARLVSAASKDGVHLALNSGFRSYAEQSYLHDGYTRGLTGFNKAAKPGFSNHQNGVAFDISVAGGDGNPTYEWLKRNAPLFGFVRTVSNEPWHWEYDEPKAQIALANGTFKAPSVMA